MCRCLPLLLAAVSVTLVAAERSGPARNAILFIGDGLAVSTVTAARIWAHGPAGRLALELPNAALVRTYSRDRLVTDSAASATALLAGQRVHSGTLGMSPATRRECSRPQRQDGSPNPVHPCAADAVPIPSIADRALAAGMAVGVVTTTRITHATPAALYAHVDERNSENEIAEQLVARADLAFVVGGGRRHFIPDGGRRSDGRDLLAELAVAGYAVASTGEELRARVADGAESIIALLAPSHLPFELERRAGAAGPSLAELTELAITRLARHPAGYLLLVEGGRIDHAEHANRAQLALAETIAFDDAIAAARERVDLEETLIVVTADHAHSLSIVGYAGVDDSILGLARARRGIERQDADGDGRADLFIAADGKGFTTLLFGTGPGRDPKVEAREDPRLLGEAVLEPTYAQQSAIPLGSSTHDGTDVIASAVGPGAEAVRGFLDQTQIFDVLVRALGLTPSER